MFTAIYLENGDLPSIIGKYKTAADAADAIEAKAQTTKNVNPYWMWVEEEQ